MNSSDVVFPPGFTRVVMLVCIITCLPSKSSPSITLCATYTACGVFLLGTLKLQSTCTCTWCTGCACYGAAPPGGGQVRYAMGWVGALTSTRNPGEIIRIRGISTQRNCPSSPPHPLQTEPLPAWSSLPTSTLGRDN